MQKKILISGNGQDITVICDEYKIENDMIHLTNASMENKKDVQQDFYMNLKYVDIISANDYVVDVAEDKDE